MKIKQLQNQQLNEGLITDLLITYAGISVLNYVARFFRERSRKKGIKQFNIENGSINEAYQAFHDEALMMVQTRYFFVTSLLHSVVIGDQKQYVTIIDRYRQSDFLSMKNLTELAVHINRLNGEIDGEEYNTRMAISSFASDTGSLPVGELKELFEDIDSQFYDPMFWRSKFDQRKLEKALKYTKRQYKRMLRFDKKFLRMAEQIENSIDVGGTQPVFSNEENTDLSTIG